MNFFRKNTDSHEAFTATISTKTPTELVMMKRNLKASNAVNKEAKIFRIEKQLLKVRG